MFLRSLSLKGFKSFADATTLELEPGLTVVVGPNGSGKSNIVDAVAWVLGAQGPRTVRSQKMEDVIFAGNGRRTALGRAEVALTIDNSAGLLPIGFTEVTLTRTLFRASGESEYAINGVPCRLLDIQELLSDTGVGRQQHVIVSQGNLDQVLDVRPEDRRLIIEEAAGILKFRRRKEKAERRLEATETHLVRLSDLLKELRRQMKPLERQAEAARRHDSLATELRALRLYLAGRSLASLRARADEETKAKARLAAAESACLAELRGLDGDVAALEERLGTVDGSGLDASAARLEAMRERARGLAAVLAERARALDAEVAAVEGGDALDLLARLETDGVTLSSDLAAAEDEAGRLVAAGAALAESEAELATRRERLAAHERAALAVRHAAEARGELAAVRASVERGRSELSQLEVRLAELDRVVAVRAQQAGAGRSALAEAEAAESEAGRDVAQASQALAAAQKGKADAASAAQRAERRRDAAEARVEALILALAAGSGASDAAEIPAALGPLLELIEIEPGWESAVEAALGDGLTALVVENVEQARAAVAAGATTLVAAGPGGPGGAGGAGGAAAALASPLRARVRSSRAEVSTLLDRLLGAAVVVDGGWEEALDLAWSRPELLVVTRAGDRFSPLGWRLAGGTPSMAAALADARRHAEAAADELEAAGVARAAADEAAVAAEAVHAERRAELHGRRQRTADQRATVARLDADHREAVAASTTGRNHLQSAAQRVSDDERRAAGLDQQLSLPLEEAVTLAPAELDAAREDVAWEAQAVAARRAQLTAQSEAVAHRQNDLRKRLADTEARMAEARAAQVATVERAAGRRVELTHVRRLAAAVTASRSRITEHLADLEQRRQQRAAVTRAIAARLEDVRRLRTEAERRLEETRAKGRRTELEEAETRLRLEAAVETLRRELDCEPDVAIAAECPPLEAGVSPQTRTREVERELRLMGLINPLAVEELQALEERHEFLSAQLDDVKTTRRDLARVIRSVEAEMTDLLAAAYADVAENFIALFETLFPGGEGSLRLTNPDSILEAGIEIEARPGGKSARKLSLLSGGERSLCALAFLFAVFRSRPSPFYLLDEVEAALDDVNLHRFLRLLDEFRNEAQLVVVSHQKRTMEAADCLFGVTMQPGGSSRVLSERVRVS